MVRGLPYIGTRAFPESGRYSLARGQATSTPSGGGHPTRGPRPRDTTAQTRTLAAPEAAATARHAPKHPDCATRPRHAGVFAHVEPPGGRQAFAALRIDALDSPGARRPADEGNVEGSGHAGRLLGRRGHRRRLLEELLYSAQQEHAVLLHQDRMRAGRSMAKRFQLG